MANVHYFVSATTGTDTNDGLDNVAIALATATWTESTFTLTQAGHGYTFSTGDLINIVSGTGVVNTGRYQIVSATSNDIVLKETSDYAFVRNATAFAAGDLATGDIVSSTGPWKTINKAMSTISDAEDLVVWCRNEATYTESPDIQTATVSGVHTYQFEGYGASLEDDTKITIVGTLTDSISTRISYCFKNIIFDANSANTNAVSLSSQEIAWRKCEFINATGTGAAMNQSCLFWDCDFSDNGSDGITCASMGMFFNCRFFRNAAGAIDGSSNVVCWNCTFFSNATNTIDAGQFSDTHIIVLNCTIDGDSRDTNKGIAKGTSFRGYFAIVNCIVYSCSTGDDAAHGDRDLLLYNLYNDNLFDHINSSEDQEGTFVTDAPDFVNEVAGADYTLNVTSPAISAGHDQANNMDIGAHQRTAVVGGGGLLMPNKRAWKQ